MERDPEQFLSAGSASREWLDAHLPAFRDAAERTPFGQSDLLYLDVRSGNIALSDTGALLVDWAAAGDGSARPRCPA